MIIPIIKNKLLATHISSILYSANVSSGALQFDGMVRFLPLKYEENQTDTYIQLWIGEWCIRLHHNLLKKHLQ